MKTSIRTATLAVGFCITFAAGATGVNLAPPDAAYENALVSMANSADARREVAIKMAEVKSSADMYRHMRSHRKDSPLLALSPAARDRFLKSLKFNEKGLTTYEYVDLEAELSVTEVYNIWALFGMKDSAAMFTDARVSSDTDEQILSTQPSMMMLPDHEGYSCVARATCETNSRYICTSNC